MLLAAGQMPDQPAIHGAEGQLAALGPRPRALHVIQNPAHLGRGKIRVEHQAGLRRNSLPGTALLQSLALRSCAPVLPDNRRMNRLAGRAIPHNHGLALVGDADGRHIARPCARFAPEPRPRNSSGWSESPSDRAPPIPPADRTAGTHAAPRRQSLRPRQTKSPASSSFPGPAQERMPSAVTCFRQPVKHAGQGGGKHAGTLSGK